jgi:hypothetical protein
MNSREAATRTDPARRMFAAWTFVVLFMLGGMIVSASHARTTDNWSAAQHPYATSELADLQATGDGR